MTETPKPPIEDMPPEEGVAPPDDDQEAETEEPQFMDPNEAANDPTIDDTENDEG